MKLNIVNVIDLKSSIKYKSELYYKSNRNIEGETERDRRGEIEREVKQRERERSAKRGRDRGRGRGRERERGQIMVQRLGRVGDESAESYPSRPAPRRVRVTSRRLNSEVTDSAENRS